MWEGQEQADMGTCVGVVFYKTITEPTFKNLFAGETLNNGNGL